MSIPNVTQRTANVSTTKPRPPAQSVTNTSITPAPASTPPVAKLPTKTVEQLQADNQNLFNLVDQLRQIASQNASTPLTPLQLSSALKSQIDVPYVGSTYAMTRSTPPILATVIADLGFELPSTVDEVTALAKKIEQRALTYPLGNLGGALSWPIPMSEEDRRSIRSFLFCDKSGLPGLPLPKHGNGTLHYLLKGSSVTHSDLQSDPQQTLQKLFDSPRAQALGQALQAHLKGVATATSIYDYLLTAMIDGLYLSGLWYPEPKKIGDVYLDSPLYWGQPPSLIAENLSKYLIKEGLATHSSAKLATHVLLASHAPQFLIKDIPQNVKVGGVLWGQLTTAAAKIEAQTPGRVPNMTYAEVIATAESLPASNIDVKLAQREALKEWGLANGVLPILQTRWTPVNGVLTPSTPEPTASQMEQARVAYNSRLQALVETSTSLYTPPASRKEIALDCLKAEFAKLDPSVFEAQVLAKASIGRARAGDPRMRSMLDIVMEGDALGQTYKWITNDRRVPLDKFNDFARSERFRTPEVFKTKFDASITAQKKGHHGMVKHLISQLPLADRKNFEFGDIECSYEKHYKDAPGNALVTVGREHTLFVKTTYKGESNLYEIDTTQGTINKQNERMTGNLKQVIKIDGRYQPVTSIITLYPGDARIGKTDNPDSSETPNSFDSNRTNEIASFYVKSLRLDDESVLNYAKGVTSYDHDRSGDKGVGEFFLNLIPFRSAIDNLAKGNVVEGIADLTMDVMGLLTFGAGKTAQAAKVFGNGAKAAKVIKFLGTSAFEVLNPLSGASDAIAGVGTLMKKGAAKSWNKGAELVNMLKGADGNYDLLKAASKNNGVVATGTYKIAETTFEGAAVLVDSKWYAYNPVNGRPYGKPRPMFTAQSVAMGGHMQEFKVLGTGLAMSADQTKRGPRLTLDAHGIIPPGHTSATMTVNGTQLTPNELVDLLKAQGVKLDKYAEIRLTMCFSATGGAHSFAAQFAKQTKKPVEGFEGIMQVNDPAISDIAARTFANKARQRDYIDDTIIGQKKHEIVKYTMTGRTADNRGIYTHSPNYNPVRFDVQGVPAAPKPPRPPYRGDAVEQPVIELPVTKPEPSNFDFDEYDDLT